MELSVVVPAHNESVVIGRLLHDLEPLAAQNAFRLVVVCNGCTDDTAGVARAAAPSALVLELSGPSKTAALNAGDAACGNVFPRFYIDADVRVTGRDLLGLSGHLTDGVLAVAPRVSYDASRSSWWVRRHLHVFEMLAPHGGGIHGTGVMGVSAEGRSRFSAWPDVTADDYYLDGLFADDEKRRVEDVQVSVVVSRRLGDLVRRRSRIRTGNAQIHSLGLRRKEHRQSPSVSAMLRTRPDMAADVAVFLLVAVLVRVRQAWNRLRGDIAFARDDSR